MGNIVPLGPVEVTRRQKSSLFADSIEIRQRKMSAVSTLLLVVALSTAAYAQEKVLMNVYYESLCPDSLQFLVNQLGPQYESLSSIMDVRLIPFGKARFRARKDAGYTFDCQHGPRECQGNMMHPFESRSQLSNVLLLQCIIILVMWYAEYI